MTIQMPRGRFYGRPDLHLVAGDLNLVRTTYGPGMRLPLHAHERPYLLAVLRGGFRERWTTHEHACEAGTLVLNTDALPHSDEFLADCTSVLNIELGPRWTEALERDAHEGGEPSPRPRCVDGRPLLGRILAIEREMQEAGSLAALLVEGLTAELVGFVARSRTGRRERAPHWLARVEAALRESYTAPPSLGELAVVAGVSPTHLARVFRAQRGTSVGGFVRRLRVESARAEILRGTKSLATIALEQGFADQSHLTRVFRRVTGTTPGQLRGRRATGNSERDRAE